MSSKLGIWLLRIILCEVKRPDIGPWDFTDKEPDQQNINKALLQLEKDIKLILALLTDIPSSKIIIETFSCFQIQVNQFSLP